jgi:hypothetical protein
MRIAQFLSALLLLNITGICTVRVTKIRFKNRCAPVCLLDGGKIQVCAAKCYSVLLVLIETEEILYCTYLVLTTDV